MEYDPLQFQELCKVNLEIHSSGANFERLFKVAALELSLGNFDAALQHARAAENNATQSWHYDEISFLMASILEERAKLHVLPHLPDE